MKSMESEESYPMRINKYLAMKGLCTRKEADAYIERGSVTINGIRAALGAKVLSTDTVVLRAPAKTYRYLAYHKPRGIITHSPQRDEKDIASLVPNKDLFPIGRLDKDSYGLIILTDDGRLTDRLLNPDREHEKQYRVTTRTKLPSYFKNKMEQGVNIEGYTTRPCTIEVTGPTSFLITLTEGKKHQIRRMCAALNLVVEELCRVRIMNIELGKLRPGQYRNIKGAELDALLKQLGITK